jgi:hypothetical protein
MDHMQFLMVRSEDSDGEISGHALMATCPPASHIKETPEEKYPQKMPDMPAGSLMTLLDMSDHVVNPYIKHEEVTPIKAWVLIRNDERSNELTDADFETIRTALLCKVRCYGYVFHFVCLSRIMSNTSPVDSVLSWKTSKSATLSRMYLLRR